MPVKSVSKNIRSKMADLHDEIHAYHAAVNNESKSTPNYHNDNSVLKSKKRKLRYYHGEYKMIHQLSNKQGKHVHKYMDKYHRDYLKSKNPSKSIDKALGKTSESHKSKKADKSKGKVKHHSKVTSKRKDTKKSHIKTFGKHKSVVKSHHSLKMPIKPKKKAPKLTRAQKLAQIKHYQGELTTKHDYSSKQFKNMAKFSSYVRRNRSHYSIPKTKKGSLDLSKATPKQLTKGQQAGIRKKLIADQKSLGPNKSAGKSLNVGDSAKQSAPQSNVATNAQTNPYANKQATNNQPIVNQSQQPQASGQVAQQPAANQYGGQQAGVQSIHPLAGRFMMRMHQATNAGLSAIRAGAGRTMSQNQVSSTGQQIVHQAASQVSHTVQQPIQRATNGAQLGDSGTGMGSAIQHGLAQDRQTQQTAQAGTQQFTSPQNQPSNRGTQFTQPTTTTATPSASTGTNQPRTAQLGGNSAYQSQLAQSQNTASQTTSQSQNQFGE